MTTLPASSRRSAGVHSRRLRSRRNARLALGGLGIAALAAGLTASLTAAAWQITTEAAVSNFYIGRLDAACYDVIVSRTYHNPTQISGPVEPGTHLYITTIIDATVIGDHLVTDLSLPELNPTLFEARGPQPTMPTLRSGEPTEPPADMPTTPGATHRVAITRPVTVLSTINVNMPGVTVGTGGGLASSPAIADGLRMMVDAPPFAIPWNAASACAGVTIDIEIEEDDPLDPPTSLFCINQRTDDAIPAGMVSQRVVNTHNQVVFNWTNSPTAGATHQVRVRINNGATATETVGFAAGSGNWSAWGSPSGNGSHMVSASPGSRVEIEVRAVLPGAPNTYSTLIEDMCHTNLNWPEMPRITDVSVSGNTWSGIRSVNGTIVGDSWLHTPTANAPAIRLLRHDAQCAVFGGGPRHTATIPVTGGTPLSGSTVTGSALLPTNCGLGVGTVAASTTVSYGMRSVNTWWGQVNEPTSHQFSENPPATGNNAPVSPSGMTHLNNANWTSTNHRLWRHRAPHLGPVMQDIRYDYAQCRADGVGEYRDHVGSGIWACNNPATRWREGDSAALPNPFPLMRYDAPSFRSTSAPQPPWPPELPGGTAPNQDPLLEVSQAGLFTALNGGGYRFVMQFSTDGGATWQNGLSGTGNSPGATLVRGDTVSTTHPFQINSEMPRSNNPAWSGDHTFNNPMNHGRICGATTQWRVRLARGTGSGISAAAQEFVDHAWSANYSHSFRPSVFRWTFDHNAVNRGCPSVSMCPYSGLGHLWADDPLCTPPMCPYPGLGHLLQTDPLCVPPVTRIEFVSTFGNFNWWANPGQSLVPRMHMWGGFVTGSFGSGPTMTWAQSPHDGAWVWVFEFPTPPTGNVNIVFHSSDNQVTGNESWQCGVGWCQTHDINVPPNSRVTVSSVWGSPGNIFGSHTVTPLILGSSGSQGNTNGGTDNGLIVDSNGTGITNGPVIDGPSDPADLPKEYSKPEPEPSGSG